MTKTWNPLCLPNLFTSPSHGCLRFWKVQVLHCEFHSVYPAFHWKTNFSIRRKPDWNLLVFNLWLNFTKPEALTARKIQKSFSLKFDNMKPKVWKTKPVNLIVEIIFQTWSLSIREELRFKSSQTKLKKKDTLVWHYREIRQCLVDKSEFLEKVNPQEADLLKRILKKEISFLLFADKCQSKFFRVLSSNRILSFLLKSSLNKRSLLSADELPFTCRLSQIINEHYYEHTKYCSY